METGRVHEAYLGVTDMRILDSGLNYVDPSTAGLSTYRARLGLGVARTDRLESAGLSQRAQPGRRGGPRTRFDGSRGVRGSSGRGHVLRVSVSGEHAGRIVGAYDCAHIGSAGAGPVIDRGYRVLLISHHHSLLLRLRL